MRVPRVEQTRGEALTSLYRRIEKSVLVLSVFRHIQDTDKRIDAT